MKKQRNNSRGASTLRIALSTGLISISAILLAVAAPTISKKTPTHDAAPTNTTSINVSTNTNSKGTSTVSIPPAPFSAPNKSQPAAPDVTLTVTTTNDSGPGSLRQALGDAHDGDTIQFDPSLNNQNITLTSAELVIDKSITISGLGAGNLRVSGNHQTVNSFRIFRATPGHTVEISGLTISGGRLQSGNGCGILNDATLTLRNCVISDNRDVSGGVQVTGAGIYNAATLSLINCTVSGNGSLFCIGGGIVNTSNLTITQSGISSNSAGHIGGGIVNSGVLRISDSTINNNQVGGLGHNSGNGGGISNSGTLTIENSTIRDNSASGEGGQGGGITNIGSLQITNSTIRNNTGIRGGGIYGLATVTNSTISGNNAFFDGGGINGTGIVSNSTISGNTANHFGGGIYGGGTITNSTFNGNIANANQGSSIYVTPQVGLTNTILKTSGSGPNISNNGTVVSHGYNLSSDNGGGFLTGPGDQINTDPLLGPLQNNGGPTLTYALLPGSPAIDAGDPNFTPPPLFDQRGVGYDRVSHGRLDIGSFEVQVCPPVITQSSSQAITTANSASCNDGSTHRDNSYWRAFDMTAPAGGGHYCITSVSFGVEFANTTQPVTVRLYTTSNFPAGFPGSLTQIGTTTINVGSTQNGTVVTTPLVTTVPAGTSQLVMELFTPNGQPGGYRFFVGSNATSETGPSYLSAPACGFTTPTTTAAVGFPNMHIVFGINGTCACAKSTSL